MSDVFEGKEYLNDHYLPRPIVECDCVYPPDLGRCHINNYLVSNILMSNKLTFRKTSIANANLK